MKGYDPKRAEREDRVQRYHDLQAQEWERQRRQGHTDADRQYITVPDPRENRLERKRKGGA